MIRHPVKRGSGPAGRLSQNRGVGRGMRASFFQKSRGSSEAMIASLIRHPEFDTHKNYIEKELVRTPMSGMSTGGIEHVWVTALYLLQKPCIF